MSLTVGGIEKFTTVNYPGQLAAVLFCRGCPIRCPYCQNPSLQDFNGTDLIPWDICVEFLESRKGLLDGIVFSGGEPLAQKDLKSAMEQVKAMGYLIGLHTSGTNAQRLADILPLTDWIGFDVKTAFDRYDRIPHANGKEAETCLDMILAAGVPMEARTTLDPRVITAGELLPLAETLSGKGVKTYAVQEYHDFPGQNGAPDKESRTAYFADKDLLQKISGLFDNFIIRRS